MQSVCELDKVISSYICLLCFTSCVLTSNHLSVSICYGYRRLDLKGGSPAGGILDSSCLYANILEWKVGSFCHSRFLTFLVALPKIVRQDEDRDTCVSKVLGFLL